MQIVAMGLALTCHFFRNGLPRASTESWNFAGSEVATAAKGLAPAHKAFQLFHFSMGNVEQMTSAIRVAPV